MAMLVDGGAYKCGNHKKEFITEDPAEWKKHLEMHARADKKEEQTIKFGSTNCAICNKLIEFKDVPSHLNPIHPECLKGMASTPTEKGFK